MLVRGVRGATTIESNTEEQILHHTTQLLHTMLSKNDIDTTHIASIFFSVTDDITATFPARAARAIGLDHVPLLCMREMSADSGLPLCIRILIHVNTPKTQQEIHHIYLNEAQKLRPEFATDTDDSVPV